MSQNEELFFEKFMAEIESQREALKSENEFIETSRKAEKQNELKDENIFKQKVAEEQKKFKAEKIALDKTLKQLKLANEKLKKSKKQYEDRLESSSEELILRLDDQNTIDVEKQFGSLFESVIESLNNLSVQSMDTQLIELRANLKALHEEKENRTKNLQQLHATLKDLESKLASSYDANYIERNVLKFSIGYQTTQVRQEYQRVRLQEESLKAKLAI